MEKFLLRFLLLAVLISSFTNVYAQNAELDGLKDLLAASTDATVVDHSDLQKGAASLNTASLSALNDPLNEPIADDQTRINTLVRAFRRISKNELDSYGLLSAKLDEHGDADIHPDSKLASMLQDAWEIRQRELKEVIESIAKPGDHMKNIINLVEKGFDKHDPTRAATLHQLLDLVDDVDNARDFYNMGGFKSLARLLESDQGWVTDEEQGLAAVAVGNVIKHDYDQQLWTLESFDTVSILQKLIMLLGDSSEETKRRSIYAISSACRGNADVQLALQEFPLQKTLLSISAESILLSRKIFAFASDMLEEYEFIEAQIQNPVELPLDGAISNQEAAAYSAAEILKQLHALKPLGATFCVSEWSEAASRGIQTAVEELEQTTDKAKLAVQQSLAKNALLTLAAMKRVCGDDIVSTSNKDLEYIDKLMIWAIGAGQVGEDLASDVSNFYSI